MSRGDPEEGALEPAPREAARPDPPPARSEAGFVSRRTRAQLLGVGLLVGAALGGLLGFALGRALPSTAQPAPAASGASRSSRNVPDFAGSEAVQSRLAAGVARWQGRQGVRRASAPPAASGRAAASSRAAELALLQRARRALNAEDGRLALGIVHELDERFPDAGFPTERQAARIVSLCSLGRSEEARRLAAGFQAHDPDSADARRVRESCAAQALE